MNVQFTRQHINRLCMPERYVVIVEDDLVNQANWAIFCANRYGGQGKTVASIIGDAVQAWCLLSAMPYKPLWIALDYDLQNGNGYELLTYLNEINYGIPIIAASGIPENNTRLVSLGAQFVVSDKAKSENLNMILNILEGVTSG